MSRENDGDLHVDLSLPADEAWLLDSANAAYVYDQLVTEIVPADQPGCTVGEPPRSPHGTYDFGICTGADIATPPVGAVISVTGPYVLDANHGWMEIHPVWRIVVLSKPPTVAPSPTPISTYPPPATGAWYPPLSFVPAIPVGPGLVAARPWALARWGLPPLA